MLFGELGARTLGETGCLGGGGHDLNLPEESPFPEARLDSSFDLRLGFFTTY
jgi:hypothetical protein